MTTSLMRDLAIDRAGLFPAASHRMTAFNAPVRFMDKKGTP